MILAINITLLLSLVYISLQILKRNKELLYNENALFRVLTWIGFVIVFSIILRPIGFLIKHGFFATSNFSVFISFVNVFLLTNCIGDIFLEKEGHSLLKTISYSLGLIILFVGSCLGSFGSFDFLYSDITQKGYSQQAYEKIEKITIKKDIKKNSRLFLNYNNMPKHFYLLESQSDKEIALQVFNKDFSKKDSSIRGFLGASKDIFILDYNKTPNQTINHELVHYNIAHLSIIDYIKALKILNDIHKQQHSIFKSLQDEETSYNKEQKIKKICSQKVENNVDVCIRFGQDYYHIAGKYKHKHSKADWLEEYGAYGVDFLYSFDGDDWDNDELSQLVKKYHSFFDIVGN